MATFLYSVSGARRLYNFFIPYGGVLQLLFGVLFQSAAGARRLYTFLIPYSGVLRLIFGVLLPSAVLGRLYNFLIPYSGALRLILRVLLRILHIRVNFSALRMCFTYAIVIINSYGPRPICQLSCEKLCMAIIPIINSTLSMLKRAIGGQKALKLTT